jgi:hypothetical protein
MMPSVTITCTNPDCEAYQKEWAVPEVRLSCFHGHCEKCYRRGRTTVKHESVVANSLDAFYALSNQLLREHRLVIRLVSSRAAEPGDLLRLDELDAFLSGLHCSFCGQEILTHEERKGAEGGHS